MLKFVTGAEHSGRTEIFGDMIKKACENGEKVLVIVPDQFSFEYDKRLYGILGARHFNSIKTAGFNRLAELISRQYGGGSRENANENAKIIVMHKAVERLKATKDVRFYKRALDKGSFISQVISLVGELIQSGITPNDLRIASEQIGGSASGKLFDLSRLYEFYLDELSNCNLKDSLTSLGECARLVADKGYFKGMSVFIDAFSSFSRDEYRLIEQMLMQARSLTVSLVISNENNRAVNRTPFAVTIRTRERIERLAMAHGVGFDEVCSQSLDYSSAELAHINKNLYCTNFSTVYNNGGVEILSANELYEETEYVCSEIARLVRDEGLEYRDIAVSARNISEVSGVIEGTFERYDIPYYIDSRQSAEQSSLVIYLKSIFECVISKEYRTENILRYIKSPLCSLYDYDICDLENYCIRWNVNGSMWTEDFTAGENGRAVPTRINDTRKKIIEPLEKFKRGSADATAGEICRALYALLEEIGISQQIFSVVRRASGSSNDTDLELGRASKQLWQTVLGAVQAIYENMGEEKISLRKFYELFSLMVSRMTVSAPPQKINSVRCIGAERSRLTDVKVLFVIEVNDGVFPATVKPTGLLTEREKKILEKTGFAVSGGVMNRIEEERLVCYQNLTMPSQKLYIISSESDLQGGKKNPSELVKSLSEMLENTEIRKIQDIPDDFFCTSYKSAYYKFLEKSKDAVSAIKKSDVATEEKYREDMRKRLRADTVRTIEKSLESNKAYRDRLEIFRANQTSQPHRLSKKTAGETFFSDSLNISATRITDFYKCPFMYFCKYGLKLNKTDRISFNQMYRGNILHQCLQMIMSVEKNGRRIYDEGFEGLGDGEIKQKIHKEFDGYFRREMGGEFGKNKRFVQEIERYEQTAFQIVKLIQRELRGSLFKPCAFEYNLTKADGESILQLKFDDNCVIKLRGSVDRADIFTDERGKRYLRIVDYKTGATKFDLAELYHGLNLQMMIYLLALTKDVNDLNPDGKLEPSGIMYSHLREFSAKLTPDEEINEDKIFKVRSESFKPDGIMIDNSDTFNALNRENGGVFTIFKLKKDGDFAKTSNQPVEEDYFKALEEFALQKVYSLAKRLTEGDITADPIQVGSGRRKKIPCTYCSYYSICGNSNPKNPRCVKSTDKDALDRELDKLMGGKGEEKNG